MQIRETSLLYQSIQHAKISCVPHVVNINQDIIPSIPFAPAPSEESIDWDWENEKEKVYNKV